MKKIYYLNVINFLAAFLLFQIELITAKIFLPKFGGSYLVWGACVVFFQCVLLLGYYYSHLVVKKLGIARYRYFHLGLLFLPLLSFPGRPLVNIMPHYNLPMVMDVFGQLMVSIGLVFFVLSTTSIIFQSWLSASHMPERSNPYALYAVSNIGSFLALLSYPFLFEPYLGLDAQLNIWRAGYLVLLGLHLVVFKSVEVTGLPKQDPSLVCAVTGKEKLRWFLFAAAGAIAFLSVTNIITYEIAPAPLLWIMPLCIYLISFVLNFKKTSYCPDWIKNKFHLTVAFSVLLFFLTEKRLLPLVLEIAAFYFLLYITCMFCQNELIRSKPKEGSDLTLFYLVISIGSFAGGFLVSWVIPLLSATMIEYLLGFVLIYLALSIGEENAGFKLYQARLSLYLCVLLLLWPVIFKGYNIFGICSIFIIFRWIYSELKIEHRAMLLNLLILFCVTPSLSEFWESHEYIYARRNYYGIYKIFEEQGIRVFSNGTTFHGGQYILPEKQMQPIMYFYSGSPIGKLMKSELFDFNTIGITGLGAGTLAAYGKQGQEIDFFELDHDVFLIANKYFTYLKKSPASINYMFGDARLELNKVAMRRYGLLVMDAFSGDSLPIHLLTTDAISDYKKRVTKDGIILFHVSNRFMDLVPVLFSNAKAVDAHVAVSSTSEPVNNLEFAASVWVALTWDEGVFKVLTSKLGWREKSKLGPIRRVKPWTDRYSHILSVLRINELINSLKEFRLFYW